MHLSNSAERFLRLGAGEPSLNLLHIVHPDLRLDLRAALYEAMNTMKSVLSRRIAMQREGETVSVSVSVHPVRDGTTSRVYALVLFDESTDAGAVPVDASLKREPFVAQLESELEASRSQLRLTVEQYETQTEELKASNEELQAINEELRSATEELETGKEELQSINEELTTVNHELKEQVDETTNANNDLQNFIGATEIAVIFVDRDLRLKRFTPSAKHLFNLLDSDVGRRLLDVTHRLRYDSFERDLASVFETLHVVERELQSDRRGMVPVPHPALPNARGSHRRRGADGRRHHAATQRRGRAAPRRAALPRHRRGRARLRDLHDGPRGARRNVEPGRAAGVRLRGRRDRRTAGRAALHPRRPR